MANDEIPGESAAERPADAPAEDAGIGSEADGGVPQDGEPIAYSALPAGVPMLTASGTVFGSVERVLEVPEEDLFDGIVVSTEAGSRFVDADQVAEITTTQVRCTISDVEAQSLPEPSGAPVYRADAERDIGSSLRDRLGRLLGHGGWKSGN